MTDTDARLRAALGPDDEAFLKSMDLDRGLFAQIGETFRGPMGWISIVANILTLIATGVGIWAIIRLLEAESVRGQILWAVAVWAAWTVQLAFKQWLWDRMNTLGVLRELKRLELRVALLHGERSGS